MHPQGIGSVLMSAQSGVMHPVVVTGGHCGGAVAVTVGQESDDSHVGGRMLVYIGPQPAQPQEVVVVTVATGE